MENERDKQERTQIYDHVFWTAVNLLKQYVPALVNEAFGEHYTEKAQVSLKPGKQVTDRPEEGFTRREADALIHLTEGVREADYHFECETNGRSTVALRIVQYGAGHAAQNASLIEDGAVIRIPHSAVIFLRAESANLKKLIIRVEYPGHVGSFMVPVLKIRDYSVADLFEKKLLLLVPFAAFRFSDEDYARMNETDVRQLKELIDEIGQRLNGMVEAGEMEPWERGNMIRYLREVLENLTKKYGNVAKGAEEIMGGYIIKTDIDIAMDEARAQGEKQGEAREEEKQKLEGIRRAIKKQKLDLQGALDYMDVPKDEWAHYTAMLREENKEEYTADQSKQ